MNKRSTQRTKWLTQVLAAHHEQADCPEHSIQTLVGDASFRRYFRIRTATHHYLLMDAPPELENSDNFIHLAHAYRQHQIRTPLIFAHDIEQGFLLLEDFGEQLLIQALEGNTAHTWYRLCYQELPKIQRCMHLHNKPLPHFVSQLLTQELDQFKNWVIEQFAQLTLSDDEEKQWQQSIARIQAVCAEQPQVGVHRDYHSRNLMILPDQSIGIIDFQDAVIGPLTYDLVSLLRDCYIDWPDEQVQHWLTDYYESFADTHAYSHAQFQRWFDWQGLQRHLKALFIFCRKYLRDGSLDYLPAIPRTFTYALKESAPYPELAWLHQFLQNRLQDPLLKRVMKITSPR